MPLGTSAIALKCSRILPRVLDCAMPHLRYVHAQKSTHRGRATSSRILSLGVRLSADDTGGPRLQRRARDWSALDATSIRAAASSGRLFAARYVPEPAPLAGLESSSSVRRLLDPYR